MQIPVASPFYRVSVKALIFDDTSRLLVFEDSKGDWEMPGGGWEYGERLEDCISRELMEEMSIVPSSIGGVRFVYTSKNEKGYYKMCVAVPVELETHDFIPSGDDLVGAKFVTKGEFMNGPFQINENGVLTQADAIWPPAARNS